MTYNPATDSYQNDIFEKILDTDFRCNIPYKINKEKYSEILKEHNQQQRIIDADVVIFCYDYTESKKWESDDKVDLSYSFFAWPKNSPENSEDYYDCFLFWHYDYENQKEAYENFVHELLKCVIGVDYEHVMNVYNDILNEREELNKRLEIVENILYENRID